MKSSLFFAFLLIGQILCQMSNAPPTRSYPYADVIYMVDETILPASGVLNFFTNFVPRLEQTLTNAGLGQQGGSGSNKYGLVLFGSKEHVVPSSVQFNGGLLVDYAQFVAEALYHVPTTAAKGNNADGWAAMDSALNYPLRPNAMRKFILITPRYRQIINNGITRNSLLARLAQQQIVLDVIVNASYVQNNEDANNMKSKTLGLFHYNRQRISVTENGLANGQNFTAGGRILGPTSSFTTIDDYVILVQELANQQCLPNSNLPILGSSWDFKFILRGGQDLEYMIKALLNTISLQVNPSLLPTLPISQPVTNPSSQSGQSGNQGSQSGQSGNQGSSQVGNQCPFSNYKPMNVNNSLFFMIGGNYSFNQATTTCIEQHAQLAIIQTIQEATALQILNSPAWVGGFIGQSNQRPGTNFVAIHSGQMIIVQSTDVFSALCYVTPAPSGCNPRNS